MNTSENIALVVFTLDQQRFALACEYIKSIVQSVEISSVPQRSKDMLGVIDVHGQIVPVLDIRRKLGVPEGEINVQDLMLIVEKGKQIFSFVVNSSSFGWFPRKNLVQAQSIVKEVECVENLVVDEKGIINILDIDALCEPHNIKIHSIEEEGAVKIQKERFGKN